MHDVIILLNIFFFKNHQIPIFETRSCLFLLTTESVSVWFVNMVRNIFLYINIKIVCAFSMSTTFHITANQWQSLCNYCIQHIKTFGSDPCYLVIVLLLSLSVPRLAWLTLVLVVILTRMCFALRRYECELSCFFFVCNLFIEIIFVFSPIFRPNVFLILRQEALSVTSWGRSTNSRVSRAGKFYS